MLKSLPESLDETYERMLCNIDPYWIEDARRMLTMLCFASRPLTVQELIDSVAVETGKSAGLNRKRRLQDFNGICEICCGLVDIVLDEDVSREDVYSGGEDEDGSEKRDPSEDGNASAEIVHKDPRTSDLAPARIVPTVRIAHFSVQEYLESNRIRGRKAARFGLSSITAHAEIAEVCLIYLLEPGLSQSKLNQAGLKEYPLAEFAATYWYYHYKKTKNSTSELDRCILRLFHSHTSFATWVRLHDADYSYPPYFAVNSYGRIQFSRPLDDIPARIYYASLLGLDKVLHGLLPSEQVESTKASAPPLRSPPRASKQIFSAAGNLGGAMHAAAYSGCDHTIQILLDSGFDINDHDERGGDSALVLASTQGHTKVVQMLLDRGADVNAQNFLNDSALQAASRWGYKEVVGALLDGGADINAQSGRFGSPLQEASREGHKEVVEILLDRGADVNAESALQKASGSGHTEIVQILLDRGADVNAESALQKASGSGHTEIVQILLNRGADVNAQSEQYGTALCLVSKMGSGNISNIMQMLLDSGARVSIGLNRALTHPVWRGESDMMQMLLNGMNAEDFDNEWRLASSSSDSWDKKIMELLQTHDFPFRHKPSVTEEA